ncbi:MAG: DEAD/DEAH box helicase [Solirubrobacterales bacterium]
MQVDSDISHLANLLGAACSATAERALHGLDVDDNGTFASYVHHRARTRPLLWPAAAHYATGALSGEPRHAVVSVPTGAGKSSVAELGIAAVLDQGWVLYLTPTNALANQVTRDLTAQFKDIEGVSVRGFIGGAEFTALGVESVGDVRERQVLVMTPEKCSLALRQSPDAFESLGLMIMDECHLLGNPGSRGVTAELTVSAVLDKAPMVRVLMLSALAENPEEIGKWLAHATDSSYQLIADPWRPTRTLRMVLGIDPVRAQEPFDQARNALEERPKGKNQAFEAPVNLMAGYQGAWETAEENDYTVIPASFSVELNARRGTDGTIRPQPTGYVNQAAGRVTYMLAMAGEDVLTFIPKNKHHNFSVARDLPDLVPKPKSDARLDSVFALLDLADHELGVETVLRNLIERGIAVHTAAMLRDEQRASEVSFADGQARAIFATTTLAQGLNLPATAVVLGGTEIGDGHSLPQDIREERTRSDLLNALGRAGRAYVASRSIGVVIPNQWIQIRRGDSPVAARNSAPFLAYPDASTQIKSQIQTLIRTALDEPEMQVDRLTEEEQATFTFLASDDAEEGQSVLRRSFGAFSTGVNADQALEVSKVIQRAGTNFVESAEAPLWIVEASRISGVGLPAMARLLASLPTEEEALPESIGDWRMVLTSGLRQMPASITARLLPEQPFQSTRMEALVESESDHDQDWNSAAEALDETLALWMDGATLDAIVGPALGKEGGDSSRGSGKPLTKVIALTTNGFGFGVARLAGGLAALWAVTEGADEDAPPGLTSEQRFALDLLPLAVRFGCNDLSSLAWYRWGFRRRRIAHMLAAEIPLPGDLSQDDHSEWVTEVRRALLLGNYEGELSPEADELVEALRLAERV